MPRTAQKTKNICDTCKLHEEIKAVDNKNSEAHEKMYARLGALESQNAVTAAEYKQVAKDIAEMKTILNMLKDEKGKKWDALWGSIVGTGVGLLFGYLFTKLIGG